MQLKRYVTEMGMGIDVHGGDYTKAAKRAVSDAIRHSSLNFFYALDKSPDDMKMLLLSWARRHPKPSTSTLLLKNYPTAR